MVFGEVDETDFEAIAQKLISNNTPELKPYLIAGQKPLKAKLRMMMESSITRYNKFEEDILNKNSVDEIFEDITGPQEVELTGALQEFKEVLEHTLDPILAKPQTKSEIQLELLNYVNAITLALPNLIKNDDSLQEYNTSAMELYQKFVIDMHQWFWAMGSFNYVKKGDDFWNRVY